MKTLLASLLCLLTLNLITPAHAEEFEVTGTVLEKGTRRPLSGAYIAVRENESLSAVTDEQGHFTLLVPDAGSYTLSAATLGGDKPTNLSIELKSGSPAPKPVLYVNSISRLEEVVVRGERSPDRVSKSVISGAELRRIPGSNGDPLRGLQALPGVVSSNNGGAPAVRGSGPGDNLYYVDSLPIGKIFHFGGISVFNGDLIQDFNLYSAAFAPRYGDVTGAVLDVALREPRTDRLGGKINVNLLGADFLVEGPVNDKQSFFFAARRSYFDLLVKRITQQGVTVQIPNYRDYQGKYLWKLNETDRITLHTQGAADEIKLSISGDSEAAKQQPVLTGDLNFSDAYSMQAVVWDSTLLHDTKNKLALEHIGFEFNNELASAGYIAIKQNIQTVRELARIPLTPDNELALGTNLSLTKNTIDANLRRTTCTQFEKNCDLSTAPMAQLTDSFDSRGWEYSLQDRLRIAPTLTLVGGLHHSGEDYLNKSYTEPRFAVEWDWNDRTLLTAGWGRHNQMPTGQQISRNFGNPNLEHLRADHSVIGISKKLDDDWTWKAESYYKKLTNLVLSDPLSNYRNGASGKAYGAELLLKKDGLSNLTGWVALSLSKSERRNDITGEAFRFQYDQPINLTLVANRKLNEDWTLGAKWNFHSGTPYTPIIGTAGNYPDGRLIPVYADVNSGTLPDYHRLDLRLDRTYVYNTWKLNTYFEWNNAYFRQNISGYRYDSTYTKKDPVVALAIPVSFGVQGEF